MLINEFISELKEELELESTLELTTNIKELEEWDSLAAMVLIAYISRSFNVTMNANDIEQITTVQTIIDFVGTEKFN
jgi:acyl carrier protein